EPRFSPGRRWHKMRRGAERCVKSSRPTATWPGTKYRVRVEASTHSTKSCSDSPSALSTRPGVGIVIRRAVRCTIRAVAVLSADGCRNGADIEPLAEFAAKPDSARGGIPGAVNEPIRGPRGAHDICHRIALVILGISSFAAADPGSLLLCQVALQAVGC